MGFKLDSFLRKRCFLFCFVHVVLLISIEIMRKKFTSVGLSYKGVLLFAKIYNVLEVCVCVCVCMCVRTCVRVYVCMFEVLGRVNITGHWRP